MNTSAIPFVQKTLGNHPAIVSVGTTATGILRQLAIKPFTPRNRRREFLLKNQIASIHANRALIFKEKGCGSIPTIVVGGFVPDATELVEFQRTLFRKYGSIYYMNYPRNGFSSAKYRWSKEVRGKLGGQSKIPHIDPTVEGELVRSLVEFCRRFLFSI